jgi:intein/homing endonuclease
MRTIADIITDYTSWVYNKTGQEYYNPFLLEEGTPNEITSRKAKIYAELLESCYDKKYGDFMFSKFILGDLTYAGYPEPIRFNKLWLKWSRLSMKHDHLAIKAARQHSKSSFWTVFRTIKNTFLFSYFNVLISSSSSDQAEKMLSYIVRIIENNEALLTKRQKDAKWSVSEIHYNGGIIVAKGVGSEVRGGTYDYVVCFDGKTLITTNKEKKMIKYIQEGDMVLTHNNRYRKVTKVYKREASDLLRVKTKYTTVMCTREHPFLTSDGWKLATELKPGDTLIAPYDPGKEHTLVFDKVGHGAFRDLKVDIKLAYFFGTIIDNMKDSHNKLTVTINKRRGFELKNVSDYLKEIGMSHTVIDHLPGNPKIHIYTMSVHKKFMEIFNGNLRKRRVPKCIMEGTLPVKAAFILGLFHYNLYGRHSPIYRKMFKSKTIIPDVEKLLADLGTPKEAKKIYYKIHSSKFNIPYCFKTVLYNGDTKHLLTVLNNEYKVISVRKATRTTGNPVKTTVYNLEVEEDNTYMANGFIVHNCDDILRSDNKLSDEEVRSYIDEELEPMLLVRKGQIVIVGTPKSPTDIFNTLEERSAAGSSWASYTFPAITNWEKKELLCPDRFTWDQLMRIRKTQTAQVFDKEFLCINISKGSQIFPIELRTAAKERGREHVLYSKANRSEMNEWTYYMGVDTARSGSAGADYTVVFVIAYNYKTHDKKIVWVWRKKGLKISEQVAQIAEISSNFLHPLILVEKNNMGQDFIDLMVDNYNLNVESFTTGGKGQSKDDLIRFMLSAFENEKFIIPQGDEYSREMMDLLDRELEKFVIHITPAGNETMRGAGRSKDDMVMALALANRCTQSGSAIPFSVSFDRKMTDLERFSHSGDFNDVLKPPWQ